MEYNNPNYMIVQCPPLGWIVRLPSDHLTYNDDCVDFCEKMFGPEHILWRKGAICTYTWQEFIFTNHEHALTFLITWG